MMRAKPEGTNAGLIVAPGDSTDTPIGPYIDFKYDTIGNLRQMSEPDGGLGRPVTDYEYDVAGNLKKITLPAPSGSGTRPFYNYGYDVAGQLKVQGDTFNRMTSYAYDGAGRLTSFTTHDVVSSYTSPGNTTAFAYDGLDNVVRVTDGQRQRPAAGSGHAVLLRRRRAKASTCQATRTTSIPTGATPTASIPSATASRSTIRSG